MHTKTISKNGLEVSALGLGCMGMSEFYGPIDEGEAIRTLEKAVELGITHFDTADVYGFGHNEELVGKVLKNHRHNLTIATKCGIVRNKNTPGERGANGRPEYVKESCEQSLKRLNMDTIDLYYIHRIDLEVPIEETVGALVDLINQGKIRYFGLSEASPDIIKRAHAVHPVAALQTEYSLWTRWPEKEVIPLCASLGIGFVAYSPLGRGFLTSKIEKESDLDPSDARHILPRLQKENFAHNFKMVEALKKYAESKGCTPAQLCLAWVLAKGDHITAIPGTKRSHYLEENCKAHAIILTPTEVAELDEIFPMGSAKGERYPPAFMTNYHLKE